MRILLALIVSVSFLPGPADAQSAATSGPGDATAGKALFEGPGIECNRCHGNQGEGGFGPTIAGRNLSLEQFQHGLRQGRIMPMYPSSIIADREAADMLAYLNSLAPVAQKGPMRVQIPENAPPGQRMAIGTVGCAQCHGAVFGSPRQALGALGGDADFAWFTRMVYDHTTEIAQYAKATGQPLRPRLVMGNYNRATVQESSLRQIYDWMNDLGIRANVAGRLSPGVPGSNGVRYTLTLENDALAGKGVTAEDVTVALRVPNGITVAAATGAGYQGVRRDEQAMSDVAVWQLPRLAAAERQTLTVTLSSAPTPTNNVRGTITWARPAVKPGPLDTANIAPPATPGGPSGPGAPAR
jgi:mono/diheme cytochrome c family protein